MDHHRVETVERLPALEGAKLLLRPQLDHMAMAGEIVAISGIGVAIDHTAVNELQ